VGVNQAYQEVLVQLEMEKNADIKKLYPTFSASQSE